MPSETTIILFAVLVVAGVIIIVLALNLSLANRAAPKRSPAPQETAPDNDALLRLMSQSIAAMLREFLPAEGASISFRVNDLLKMMREALTILQALRQSTDEARNTAHSAQMDSARVENQIGNLGVKLDALAVAQARQADAVMKLTNNIVSVPGHAEQVAAGSGIDQVIKAGDKVVLDKVKE